MLRGAPSLEGMGRRAERLRAVACSSIWRKKRHVLTSAYVVVKYLPSKTWGALLTLRPLPYPGSLFPKGPQSQALAAGDGSSFYLQMTFPTSPPSLPPLSAPRFERRQPPAGPFHFEDWGMLEAPAPTSTRRVLGRLCRWS